MCHFWPLRGAIQLIGAAEAQFSPPPLTAICHRHLGPPFLRQPRLRPRDQPGGAPHGRASAEVATKAVPDPSAAASAMIRAERRDTGLSDFTSMISGFIGTALCPVLPLSHRLHAPDRLGGCQRQRGTAKSGDNRRCKHKQPPVCIKGRWAKSLKHRQWHIMVLPLALSQALIEDANRRPLYVA
jgi:hypothetical protein